ncbi:MAG: hypothetical protein PVS3B1_00600 [Ktedonobacteraceae bacterium]
MDFVDWRKKPDQPAADTHELQKKAARHQARRMSDYVEEMIREAQARGDFDNLAGTGKPLNLDDGAKAGDKSMAYNLLKNNDLVPPEIELAKDIDIDLARADAKVARMLHRSNALRTRRMPAFEREKRAFNTALEKVATDYEQLLRRINSKILTLNITTPPAMHRPLVDVDALVKQFRADCLPFQL